MEILDTVLNLKEMNKVFAAELNIEDPADVEAARIVMERNKLENSKGNDRGSSVGSHRKTD